MASSVGTPPEVLTVDEAWAVLRLGRITIYDALGRGEISHVRVGRRILIPRDGLLRFLSIDPRTDSRTNAPGQEGTRGDWPP